MEKRNKRVIIGNGLSEPFIVGSSYFFSDFDDFISKDKDVVIFVDEPILFNKVMTLRGRGDDVFYWKKMTPDEYVEDLLETTMPMRAGKFLCKELCSYIGFTFDDLKKLSPVFANMDERHSYEKIIFDAYMENGEYRLTKNQLENAYKMYKEKKDSQH